MSAENHRAVVSILTPAYNAESYIGEAISSALAQTFSAFELIVVDDGSTDRTSAVAEEYARRDARVHVIRQTNGGTAKARNTAISASRGDYVALLDSDDRWMPDFLEVTFTTLSTHPELDVVSANAINFGAERDGTPWKPVFDGLKPVSLRDIIEVEDSICIAAMFRRLPLMPEMFITRTAGSSKTGSNPAPMRPRMGLADPTIETIHSARSLARTSLSL